MSLEKITRFHSITGNSLSTSFVGGQSDWLWFAMSVGLHEGRLFVWSSGSGSGFFLLLLGLSSGRGILLIKSLDFVLAVGHLDQETSIERIGGGEDLETSDLCLVEVVPVFGGEHALDAVLLVSRLVSSVLHKANHSLIADRIELSFHEIVDVIEDLGKFC